MASAVAFARLLRWVESYESPAERAAELPQIRLVQVHAPHGHQQ
jgi:hypothetical protein